jgi:hypothetical protein
MMDNTDLKTGVRFSSEEGIFPFTITGSRPTLWPIQRLIQCVPSAPSLEVKRPERDADYSPPTSAEFKNASSLRGALLSTRTTLSSH